MAEISSSSYNETDASNNTASPDGWPEGMAMSGINNSGRQMMGAVKRWWNRANGAYASTGATNTYAVSSSVALSAYVTGERYSFRSHLANTGSAALNWSSLGAKTIKKYTSSGKSDLSSGDIQANQPVTVEYDGSDMIICTRIANVGVTAGTGTTVSGSAVSIDKGIQADLEAQTSNKVITADNAKWLPMVAKGWVNFNGSGTIAISASLNVSSITDNGVGDYTVNWTTPFSSASYAVAFGGNAGFYVIQSQTSSTVRFTALSTSAASADFTNVSVVAFGDQ